MILGSSGKGKNQMVTEDFNLSIISKVAFNSLVFYFLLPILYISVSSSPLFFSFLRVLYFSVLNFCIFFQNCFPNLLISWKISVKCSCCDFECSNCTFLFCARIHTLRMYEVWHRAVFIPFSSVFIMSYALLEVREYYDWPYLLHHELCSF